MQLDMIDALKYIYKQQHCGYELSGNGIVTRFIVIRTFCLLTESVFFQQHAVNITAGQDLIIFLLSGRSLNISVSFLLLSAAVFMSTCDSSVSRYWSIYFLIISMR